MSLEELSKKFLDFPSEENSTKLLKYLSNNNLFHLGSKFGKYIETKYEHSYNIKSDTSLNLHYSKKYKESFEISEKLLTNLKNLDEKKSQFAIYNQHHNIKHISDNFIYYNENKVKEIFSRKKSVLSLVTMSITTCKRFDLFEKTINSFINCCDVEIIDEWICVDDNSSEEDRDKMKELYPFFTFIFKTKDQKGHANSMNIIRNNIKTPYLLHMEDDFKFFSKREYIKNALEVLGHNNKIGQCLFNKNYTETENDIIVKGGEFFQTNGGFRYYVHEFANTAEKLLLWSQKHGNSQSSNYWPHFSFRPSLLRTEIYKEIGEFNINADHFEMEYANRYVNKGYVSAFFEGIYCIHIGRLTSERHDDTKINAYKLNNEAQFSSKKNNSCFIKIVNLERRKDRKEQTIIIFKNSGIDENNYEFVKAIDGRELISESEDVDLFEGNDFGSRRGFIGCALTHYNLWKKLIEDKNHDFYLIMEDDCTLSNNFKEKIEKLKPEMSEKEVIFLGYHMFSKDRERLKNVYENDEILIEKLKKDLYVGGYYCYSINKVGALKMINYITQNGIKHGIDYLNKIMDIDSYEVIPQIAFSIWNEGGKKIDTDIQNVYDNIQIIPKKDFLSNFVFIKGKDQMGNDLYFLKKSLNECIKIALEDNNCEGFNTLGFFKNKIENLTDSQYFKENDGIYIKKKCIHKNIRIKMICNWCSSEQLCKEWSNMCDNGYKWKNIEITSSDDNIDYYVIINKPINEDIFYDPKKTLIFQMEPWIYYKNKNWGVKTWGKWSEPNEKLFLHVGIHKKYLNNVQWQIEKIPINFPEKRKDKVISVLSNKNFDEGHVKRIDFIKFLEAKDENIVDIYGRENYHEFKNYQGKLIDDKKENNFVEYKYCFSVENNNEINYATEKIWEPILCESLCFYWGCPNLEDYMDNKAFVRLDLKDFEGSLKLIKQAIEEDWWSQRIDIIKKEKQKIINELGFFPNINKIINSL